MDGSQAHAARDTSELDLPDRSTRSVSVQNEIGGGILYRIAASKEEDAQRIVGRAKN